MLRAQQLKICHRDQLIVSYPTVYHTCHELQLWGGSSLVRIMEKFWDRFPNFSGKSRKFSNVIPMNSPYDADYKYIKEFHFRPFWAVFDFLSTMFQVMYYLHYRFLRPVLSCVISGPSELSSGTIKFFGLFPTLWWVCESLHGVAHNRAAFSAFVHKHLCWSIIFDFLVL